MVYLLILSVPQNVQHEMAGQSENDEPERMWKEAVVA
jgi:hypothetical protein